jgi:glycosyltransferase involved in cell wall biosynthesis
MRIAYDITQTGVGKAGCGYLAYSLIQSLAEIDTQNEYLLLSSFGENYWDENTSPAACGINKPNFKHGLRHADHAATKRFWRTPPADLDAALGNPDIVHANNFYCPTGLRNAHLIYTLYDLNFIDHPEWTTEANRLACFKGVYNASLYADSIIAISEFSRQHFIRTFPHYPVEKIHVIYPASRYAQRIDIQRPANLPAQVNTGQFWLCVGTLEPRKNQLGLLRAYAQHKAKTGQVLPLVHAGGPGWLMDDFKNQISVMGLEDDVILLGYVDELTLQWLYQNCFAFIYPSLFEGFGLPVLEAMSLGSAVITSNTTSIPEIVGQAGTLVDPLNIDQIANAMDELSANTALYSQLKTKAISQSSFFSWEKSARETLEVYKQLG